ncbi:MAG: hypothetical protein ACLGH3_02910 [Actinomycetota bacterium]
MLADREDYNGPVEFAREPAGERRKWVGRFFLALVVAGIFWLMVNRVLSPSDDTRRPNPTEETLPGPV